MNCNIENNIFSNELELNQPVSTLDNLMQKFESASIEKVKTLKSNDQKAEMFYIKLKNKKIEHILPKKIDKKNMNIYYNPPENFPNLSELKNPEGVNLTNHKYIYLNQDILLYLIKNNFYKDTDTDIDFHNFYTVNKHNNFLAIDNNNTIYPALREYLYDWLIALEDPLTFNKIKDVKGYKYKLVKKDKFVYITNDSNVPTYILIKDNTLKFLYEPSLVEPKTKSGELLNKPFIINMEVFNSGKDKLPVDKSLIQNFVNLIYNNEYFEEGIEYRSIDNLYFNNYYLHNKTNKEYLKLMELFPGQKELIKFMIDNYENNKKIKFKNIHLSFKDYKDVDITIKKINYFNRGPKVSFSHDEICLYSVYICDKKKEILDVEPIEIFTKGYQHTDHHRIFYLIKLSYATEFDTKMQHYDLYLTATYHW